MKSRTARTFASCILLTLLLLPTAAALEAQQGTVRGRVLDERGDAVPGAAVRVQGTNTATVVTDDGSYSLSLAPGAHEIEASAFGYRAVVQTVTLSAGATETFDFTIAVSAIQLEQVVASVEAGEVTRREMGTDIASVDVAQQLPNAAVANVSELLNARVPNVTITQASGNVGSGSRIRVRGINSLTQSNNPLIIIDGVRGSNDTDVGINRGQDRKSVV